MRARVVPVIVPLNSPAKEVFVLVEDTLLALFFREAMLSDAAEFLLLWLILLVVNAPARFYEYVFVQCQGLPDKEQSQTTSFLSFKGKPSR